MKSCGPSLDRPTGTCCGVRFSPGLLGQQWKAP